MLGCLMHQPVTLKYFRAHLTFLITPEVVHRSCFDRVQFSVTKLPDFFSNEEFKH